MKNVQPSLLLLAAVGAALLPHLYAQPAWLAIVLFFLLLLRGVMRYRQVQSVPRWLATVLAVTLAMAVFQAHQSLIGREGGIALLACLIIAKLFESRDLRDQTVLVMLGYFSTVAFFLHAQSPVMALMALASCLLLTSANLQRVQPQSRSSHPIRQAGGLLLQALPLALLLFTSRQGFCEHFASSFAYLMRAAGVPARIVTGYQGGSWNKAGNYLIVRQADAHAWVEVWLDGQGWQRIDPTAAVAPQRISQGLSASVPQGDTLPLMLRSESSWLKTLRLNADVLVNGWNHWVIGYNRQRQLDLLGMLGIGELGSGRYVVWLLGSFLLVSGLLVTWIMRPQRKLQEDQARRLYQVYCRKLARCRISVLPQEGPSDFARRAAMARPDLAQDIQSITTCYLAVRYGEKQEMMHVLQRLVRQFSP